jgi:predicted dehydrogenase
VSALRVGVVGGGLIAQAVHLPNLARDPERFELTAVADPSAGVRDVLGRTYAPARTYAHWQEMLDQTSLDALVVCSPHATHADVVLSALDLGLHVFVEKPLCITVEDAEAIAEHAERAGRVVQVGYMKRFHPAFDALVAGLRTSGGELRLVDVVTFDPWMAREPYVPWTRMAHADDVPPGVLSAAQESERAQVERAIGEDSDEAIRAFSYTFLACLVHDVNLVANALEAVGATGPPRPLSSHAWANGEAASATLELAGGGLWHCTWLLLRAQERFREQVGFYLVDGVHELEFPVPYDVAAPVRHRISGAESKIVADPYVVELEHFYDCIAAGEPCLTPPRQAARDLAILRDLFLAGRATQPAR